MDGATRPLLVSAVVPTLQAGVTTQPVPTEEVLSSVGLTHDVVVRTVVLSKLTTALRVPPKRVASSRERAAYGKTSFLLRRGTALAVRRQFLPAGRHSLFSSTRKPHLFSRPYDKRAKE